MIAIRYLRLLVTFGFASTTESVGTYETPKSLEIYSRVGTGWPTDIDYIMSKFGYTAKGVEVVQHYADQVRGRTCES